MTILVPIDPTEPSRAAVWLAGLLADRGDHELLLLHAASPRPSLDTLAALHRIAEPLRREGLRVRLRTVDARPEEAIPREAEARACAWVVMGTRGSAQADKSLAMSVMARSSVRVVAVRPGKHGPLRPGRVGWVAAPGSASCDIAEMLAAVRNTEAVSLEPDLQLSPPVRLSGGDPVKEGFASMVLDFAPDCANAGWCRRMLTESESHVILVGSERCGCEADPTGSV